MTDHAGIRRHDFLRELRANDLCWKCGAPAGACRGDVTEACVRLEPPVFVRRCAVCGHEVHEGWGPETHTLAHQRLVEHVNQHTDAEIRAWALPLIVGRSS